MKQLQNEWRKGKKNIKKENNRKEHVERERMKGRKKKKWEKKEGYNGFLITFLPSHTCLWIRLLKRA